MRRALVLALTLSTIALTACPSPPKNGECKSSKDCEAQAGFGKVCVQGRCAECAADSDCKAGFVCTGNTCQPKPGPADTSATTTAPRAECVADGECGAGKACQAGRCVTAAVDPACADPAAFTVHFGFDRADISASDGALLQKLSACLQKSPARRVQVDGHCDERGTTQYNLALGKKRAEAVKKYLADLGAGAVETNTYGKEQPLCRESSEDCWARNRRAAFTIER
jgi:peptidoglycan-associated lipoprotein